LSCKVIISVLPSETNNTLQVNQIEFKLKKFFFKFF